MSFGVEMGVSFSMCMLAQLSSAQLSSSVRGNMYLGQQLSSSVWEECVFWASNHALLLSMLCAVRGILCLLSKCAMQLTLRLGDISIALVLPIDVQACRTSASLPHCRSLNLGPSRSLRARGSGRGKCRRAH